MKLELQVTLDTGNCPNEEGHIHSWIATCQALIGEFLRNLQDKSSFSL